MDESPDAHNNSAPDPAPQPAAPSPPDDAAHLEPAPWPGLPRLSLYGNPISIVGLVLAGFALLMILTYMLFELVVHPANPYVDIIGFLILPSIFVLGLLLVPVGILFRLHWLRRHAARYQLTFRLPHIDLNSPTLRRRLAAFALLNLFVILPVLAVTSYEGYGYTESSEFCGQTCHKVMAPEATAHSNSPHARVTCAECHIGAGASWFVKSKLSGLRQVYAVAFNTYHRPIPPAITELRPARETCEQCHWPAKFFGDTYKEIVHFSPDEHNTRRTVRLFLHVGGADESIGRVEGIHMHMLVAGKIEYVASDSILQDIPWVKYTTAAGVVHVYRADGQPADAPPPPGIVRQVDCMDCHNRGAHHFRSPQAAADLFLNVNRIDPNLPYIKREAVRALQAGYSDDAAADRAIEQRLTEFYQKEYPQVWATQRPAIEQAARSVQELYRRSTFPGMNVDWRTYPENIGHLTSAGCIRCHDGLHKDASGTAISSSCDTCHVFLNPVESRATTAAAGQAVPRPTEFAAGPFQHSMDLSQHKNLRCSECHDGGELRLCADCHKNPAWMEKWHRGHFRPTTTSSAPALPAQ